ncbi:MAG: hypothetical protein J0H44_03475 [Alphaproteobacteria bacterium]|nr:hypothetical protein [Alphaproteobacteria bacterium]
MKTYTGDRTIDGIQVLVDGRPLDPRTDLKPLSKNGFEWSYEGPEPAQLAFALLVDHLSDPQRADAMHEAFMREIVANFDNTWELTSADIDADLAALAQ